MLLSIIKNSMEQLALETNEKIENIIKYIKNLEAEAEALEKESKRLNDRKVKTLKKVENLKNYLKDFTNTLDSKKYHTGIFNISIRKNAASVVIDNEFLVPDKFCKTEVIRKVDKAALKEKLKAGEVIEGVKLQQSESIIIK